MSRDKSLGGERAGSRAWLGPPARGGERLARVFGIGSPAERDVEQKLADLHASLSILEDELSELSRGAGSATVTDPFPAQPPPPVVELRRIPLASDRDYWLCRCEQFAVYTGEHLLGVVQGMRFQSRVDRPDLLEVRCGRLGRQLLLIPISDVEAVEPEEKTIVLQTQGRVAGRRERLHARLEQLFAPLHALLH